jgi:hypothetical protein
MPQGRQAPLRVEPAPTTAPMRLRGEPLMIELYSISLVKWRHEDCGLCGTVEVVE